MQEIAINNGWNTQIVKILHEIRDGNFLFKGTLFGRLTKFFELSHEWINTNFKYQEPEFYSRCYGETVNGLFNVSTGLQKYIIKSLPDAPK